MTARKQGYRPAGDGVRETLADLPAPNPETVRQILAILRGGAR